MIQLTGKLTELSSSVYEQVSSGASAAYKALVDTTAQVDTALGNLRNPLRRGAPPLDAAAEAFNDGDEDRGVLAAYIATKPARPGVVINRTIQYQALRKRGTDAFMQTYLRVSRATLIDALKQEAAFKAARARDAARAIAHRSAPVDDACAACQKRFGMLTRAHSCSLCLRTCCGACTAARVPPLTDDDCGRLRRGAVSVDAWIAEATRRAAATAGGLLRVCDACQIAALQRVRTLEFMAAVSKRDEHSHLIFHTTMSAVRRDIVDAYPALSRTLAQLERAARRGAAEVAAAKEAARRLAVLFNDYEHGLHVLTTLRVANDVERLVLERVRAAFTHFASDVRPVWRRQCRLVAAMHADAPTTTTTAAAAADAAAADEAPEILHITPVVAPLDGQTPLTIYGERFPMRGVSVLIGGVRVPAADTELRSATCVHVRRVPPAPGGAPCTVPVVVSDGTAATEAWLDDVFSYVVADATTAALAAAAAAADADADATRAWTLRAHGRRSRADAVMRAAPAPTIESCAPTLLPLAGGRVAVVADNVSAALGFRVAIGGVDCSVQRTYRKRYAPRLLHIELLVPPMIDEGFKSIVIVNDDGQRGSLDDVLCFATIREE